jgi:hypothetical protein
MMTRKRNDEADDNCLMACILFIVAIVLVMMGMNLS